MWDHLAFWSPGDGCLGQIHPRFGKTAEAAVNADKEIERLRTAIAVCASHLEKGLERQDVVDERFDAATNGIADFCGRRCLRRGMRKRLRRMVFSPAPTE
jgi:hypothetical protein